MALITPIGLLTCYGPTLFVAKRSKFDPTKDPRFEAFLTFSAALQATPEYAAIRAALGNVLKEAFGTKMNDASFKARLKLPLKPNDKAADGSTILKAWTTSQPQVVDSSLQTITVPGDVWSGQLARFEVGCKAFDKAGSVGANFYLNNVQITKRDMPRMDGKTAADKVFGKVEEEGGSSLGGAKADLDDDMPF